jgi:LmbE family N-acetylglucosaminyl deacetylase
MAKGRSKGKSKFVVVCDDHDDNLHIGHSRTVKISDNGFHILQTPRSPVKVSSASRLLVEQEFDDWNPSIEYNNFEEDSTALNVEENVQSTMAAKVAAKRYPTSVSCSKPENETYFDHHGISGCSIARVGWKGSV